MLKRKYNENNVKSLIDEISGMKDFDRNFKNELLSHLHTIHTKKKIEKQDYDIVMELCNVIYLSQLQDETNKIIKNMNMNDTKIKQNDLIHFRKNIQLTDFEYKEKAIKLINRVINIRLYLTPDIIDRIVDMVQMINDDKSARLIDRKINIIEREIKTQELNKEDIDEQDKQEYNILFMNSKVRNKIWLSEQEINVLFKQPLSNEDNEGSYKSPKPNSIHQIDTLFLPTDTKTKDKYLLVCTDVYNRMTDAEPMKNKDAETVKNSLLKIYKRGFLKIPLEIVCDDGKEFKGNFLKYFKSQKVYVKSLPPGKHLGIVDRRIQIIGNAIMKGQAQEELKTNKTYTDWTHNINIIIDLLNKYSQSLKIPVLEPFNEDGHIDDVNLNKSKSVVQVGTRVHKILYYPIDNTAGKRLHGKFRTGDIRYEKKISIITGIIMRPDSPIYYVLDNDDKNPLNRNEFIIIKNSKSNNKK
jgi:hypothetical protein